MAGSVELTGENRGPGQKEHPARQGQDSRSDRIGARLRWEGGQGPEYRVDPGGQRHPRLLFRIEAGRKDKTAFRVDDGEEVQSKCGQALIRKVLHLVVGLLAHGEAVGVIPEGPIGAKGAERGQLLIDIPQGAVELAPGTFLIEAAKPAHQHRRRDKR